MNIHFRKPEMSGVAIRGALSVEFLSSLRNSPGGLRATSKDSLALWVTFLGTGGAVKVALHLDMKGIL